MKKLQIVLFSCIIVGLLSTNIYGFKAYDLSLNDEVENISLDMLSNLPNEADIEAFEYLVKKDVLLVRNSGIEPFSVITREDFLVMFFRLMTEYKYSEVSETPYYHDVEVMDWYAGYVEWARYNGVARGISEDVWGIGLNLTKEQMCKMAYGYILYNNIEVESSLDMIIVDDGEISDWAKEHVYWCVDNVVVELNEGKINPKETITWNESVRFLMNLDLLLESR